MGAIRLTLLTLPHCSIAYSRLVASCSYFAAALSGNWAETQAATAGVDTSQVMAKSHPDTAHNSYADTADHPIPSLHFPQGPQAVYDLLAFLDPHARFLLSMGTVEPLLSLADMIDLKALKPHCEKFLQARVRSDPVEILRLAETYRLGDLCASASAIVLEMTEEIGVEQWHKLSETTILKVSEEWSAMRSACFRSPAAHRLCCLLTSLCS